MPHASKLFVPAARRFASLVLATVASLAPGPAAAVDEIGADDFRLSAMGGIGDNTYRAATPVVAYNPDDDEYLVVWAGDTNAPPFSDDQWGIFGQRIDAATGAEVGPDDFAITGVIDGGAGSNFFRPAVAYNPDQGEYLVTWTGNTGLCCGQDYEVYARRVSAAGAPVGPSVQVSHMADENNEHTFDAFESAVAYNPLAGEYLVVWSGDDGEDGRLDEEFEILGQRLSSAGAEIGARTCALDAACRGAAGDGVVDAAGEASALVGGAAVPLRRGLRQSDPRDRGGSRASARSPLGPRVIAAPNQQPG